MKYIGIKEVLKAVETDDVSIVYIGKDAENHVISELLKMCKEKNIEISYVETMAELGKMANIDVGAAAAAD